MRLQNFFLLVISTGLFGFKNNVNCAEKINPDYLNKFVKAKFIVRISNTNCGFTGCLPEKDLFEVRFFDKGALKTKQMLVEYQTGGMPLNFVPGKEYLLPIRALSPKDRLRFRYVPSIIDPRLLKAISD
jgi:hypothetical protein